MNTTDRKVLAFLDHLKQIGTVRFDIDFCRAIDMQKQRLYAIKKQNKHFTTTEIQSICRVYKLNAIFNNDTELFYHSKNSNINNHKTQAINLQIIRLFTNTLF